MSETQEQQTPTAIDMGIQSLHLTNQTELIGHVWVLPEMFRVERPVIPVMRQSSNGFDVQLLPFRPYLKDDTIDIMPHHVVVIAAVAPGMETGYKQFVSNIKLASDSEIKQVKNNIIIE